ncbi:hypothetical protein [Streptomyces platensis]
MYPFQRVTVQNRAVGRGPSVPEALAATVGPAGHVLATDIDPS